MIHPDAHDSEIDQIIKRFSLSTQTQNSLEFATDINVMSIYSRGIHNVIKVDAVRGTCNGAVIFKCFAEFVPSFAWVLTKNSRE